MLIDIVQSYYDFTLYGPVCTRTTLLVKLLDSCKNTHCMILCRGYSAATGQQRRVRAPIGHSLFFSSSTKGRKKGT